jgi:hypothetical protein
MAALNLCYRRALCSRRIGTTRRMPCYRLERCRAGDTIMNENDRCGSLPPCGTIVNPLTAHSRYLDMIRGLSAALEEQTQIDLTACSLRQRQHLRIENPGKCRRVARRGHHGARAGPRSEPDGHQRHRRNRRRWHDCGDWQRGVARDRQAQPQAADPCRRSSMRKARNDESSRVSWRG